MFEDGFRLAAVHPRWAAGMFALIAASVAFISSRPALLLRGRHQRSEVEHRAREPIEFRDGHSCHKTSWRPLREAG